LRLGRLLQVTAFSIAAFSFVERDASGIVLSQFQESVGATRSERFSDSPTSIASPGVDILPELNSTALASPFKNRMKSPSVTESAMSPEKLRSLMRPKVSFNSEWLTSSDFDLSRYDVRVSVPTYPFFGPPPPMVNVGVSCINLIDADSFGLPDDLFEYSVGLSWVRPLKDRWIVRSMLGVAMATDNRNTSSDAWQFRGGLFAAYEPNNTWQWVFGAIAIGRNDLPVVPAVGVIWTPRPDVKIDLTFPKPRIQKLLAETESRQQWGYFGMAIGGGTWGLERADRTDDQLTYGDWRVVTGWESLPTPVAGERFTRGRRLGLEVGYVFSRDLEFSSGSPDISLSDAVVIGITTNF
jgi:Domain of unknown function (DUF6268)